MPNNSRIWPASGLDATLSNPRTKGHSTEKTYLFTRSKSATNVCNPGSSSSIFITFPSSSLRLSKKNICVTSSFLLRRISLPCTRSHGERHLRHDGLNTYWSWATRSSTRESVDTDIVRARRAIKVCSRFSSASVCRREGAAFRRARPELLEPEPV